MIKAWACVGSHGKIFATEFSPHPPCVGRLQIYLFKVDALSNDSRVIEVEIREVPKKVAMCGQCGGRYSDKACGPTHAALGAALARKVKR
jgi:hypothetical protein